LTRFGEMLVPSLDFWKFDAPCWRIRFLFALFSNQLASLRWELMERHKDSSSHFLPNSKHFLETETKCQCICSHNTNNSDSTMSLRIYPTLLYDDLLCKVNIWSQIRFLLRFLKIDAPCRRIRFLFEQRQNANVYGVTIQIIVHSNMS
jgi:hypothetical protein